MAAAVDDVLSAERFLMEYGCEYDWLLAEKGNKTKDPVALSLRIHAGTRHLQNHRSLFGRCYNRRAPIRRYPLMVIRHWQPNEYRLVAFPRFLVIVAYKQGWWTRVFYNGKVEMCRSSLVFTTRLRTIRVRYAMDDETLCISAKTREGEVCVHPSLNGGSGVLITDHEHHASWCNPQLGNPPSLLTIHKLDATSLIVTLEAHDFLTTANARQLGWPEEGECVQEVLLATSPSNHRLCTERSSRRAVAVPTDENDPLSHVRTEPYGQYWKPKSK